MLKTILFLLGVAVAGNVAADGVSTHFNQAHELARATLGIGTAPRMAYIPRSVLEAEDADRALGKLCKLVAEAFDASKSQTDNWAVASVDDEAEVRLLECIDQTLEDTELPKLRLVFVGSREREPAARAIVESWGATFYFAPDPDRDRGV